MTHSCTVVGGGGIDTRIYFTSHHPHTHKPHSKTERERKINLVVQQRPARKEESCCGGGYYATQEPFLSEL